MNSKRNFFFYEVTFGLLLFCKTSRRWRRKPSSWDRPSLKEDRQQMISLLQQRKSRCTASIRRNTLVPGLFLIPQRSQTLWSTPWHPHWVNTGKSWIMSRGHAKRGKKTNSVLCTRLTSSKNLFLIKQRILLNATFFKLTRSENLLFITTIQENTSDFTHRLTEYQTFKNTGKTREEVSPAS